MTKTFKGESSESAQARAEAFVSSNASVGHWEHWEMSTEKIGREYVTTLIYNDSINKGKYAENEEITKEI
jgi:hypothetical protein